MQAPFHATFVDYVRAGQAYSGPTVAPSGIDWALVNGQVAVDHGRVANGHAGGLLRRRA